MYLFLDTETTGVKRFQDRIVQVAWILADLDGTVISEDSHIIKPEGFVIPVAASNIHGITTARATSCGEALGSVLNKLSADAETADMVVAHNIGFDLGILENDYKQAGLPFPFNGKTHICTMKLSIKWCQLPKLNGQTGFKYPKLEELHYRLFGKSFDGAHDALEDTRACMRCFLKLMRLGVITQPLIISQAPPEIAQPEWVEKTVATPSTTNKPKERIDQASCLSESELIRSSNPAHREMAARNPHCSVLALFELASDSNMNVLKAVISNPKVTSKVLERVCAGFKEGEDVEILRLIAVHRDCPEYFHEVVFEFYNDNSIGIYFELAIAAATNPSCPPDYLEIYSKLRKNSMLIKAIIENPAVTTGALHNILEDARSNNDLECKCLAARHPKCPRLYFEKWLEGGEFEKFTETVDERLTNAIAQNPSCPPEVLATIKGSSAGSGEVARKASDIRSRPLQQQKAAADDIQTSGDELEMLATSLYVDVRCAVARNTGTPQSSLKALSQDTAIEVRREIANNKKTASADLDVLAQETDWVVIAGVLMNANSWRETVFRLTKKILASRKDVPDRFFELISDNARCPRAFFPILCAHASPQIRLAAARNPKCSRKGLEVLAEDPIFEWRELAARHPNCPPELFAKLASDPVGQVRRAVIQNDACPIEIRAPLYMMEKSGKN